MKRCLVICLMFILSQSTFANDVVKSKTYSVSVAPVATAYTGEHFSRHFTIDEKLEIYAPSTEMISTQDAITCDSDDDGREENCKDICVASVTYPIGRVTISVTDTDSLITKESDTSEIKGSAGITLDGKCEGRVPKITDLNFTIYNLPGNHVFFGQSSADQYVWLGLLGTLNGHIKALGNDNYEFTTVDLPAELKGMYGYYQTVNWGVSSVVTLQNK